MKIAHGQYQRDSVLWVDSRGNPVTVSRGMAANGVLEDKAKQIERGEVIGNVRELVFRDSNYFRAGELRSNATYWEEIARRNPLSGQNEILGWIRERVSIFPYFKHFSGQFKGEKFDSDRHPRKAFKHNASCKPVVSFIQKTLMDRLRTRAISWLGRVGEVEPSFLVLPLRSTRRAFSHSFDRG